MGVRNWLGAARKGLSFSASVTDLLNLARTYGGVHVVFAAMSHLWVGRCLPCNRRNERTRPMARISLDPPRSLVNRLAGWYSRRTFGAELDPGRAMGHQPKVLMSVGRFEGSVDRWSRLDPRLKHLAVMAAAHAIGCRWCTDFGYWLSHSDGIPAEMLRDVPTWRSSDRFTPVERQVLEYAEAMCATPDEVTDEMVSALDAALGTPALVELTMMVAVENQRSRFNSALGLTSQGFADRCEVSS